MHTKLLTFAVLAVVATSCTEAQGQLFRKMRQAGQARIFEKGRSSLEHVPLTRVGKAIKAPRDARVYALAAKTGRSPEQIRGRRMQALETAGAALSGAASGLEAAGSSIGSFTPPSTVGRTYGPTLPSNFSQQMNWNSFNRNYSQLPYHRGAGGY